MSLYLIVFFFLVAGVAIKFFKNRDFDRFFYYTGFFIMLLMMLLRFGQGADYFGYLSDLKSAENNLQRFISEGNTGLGDYFSFFASRVFSLEGGFNFLNIMAVMLLRYIGVWATHQLMICLFAVFSMWQVYRFIKEYCSENMTLALAMIYPTFYMTYLLSGIGQGLVMSFFLGTGLKLLENKSYIKYIFMVVILSWFHRSAVFYILCPIFLLFKDRILEYMILASIPLSIIFYLSGLSHRFELIAGDQFTNVPGRAGIFAIIERAFSLLVVIFLIKTYKENAESKELRSVEVAYRVYLSGALLYILLAFNGFVASRTFALFKPLEIMIVAQIIGFSYMQMNLKRMIVFLELALCTIMLYKNIVAYIYQLGYDCNVMDYPYYSIFIDEDKKAEMGTHDKVLGKNEEDYYYFLESYR